MELGFFLAPLTQLAEQYLDYHRTQWFTSKEVNNDLPLRGKLNS